MKIIVLNRDKIKDYVTLIKHVVISIRDPETPKADLAKSGFRLDTLYFEFSDTDVQVTDEVILFNKENAKEILQFVKKYENDIGAIICQCEAGISRSAGVAAALSKIINGCDNLYFRKYIPNKLVYSTILKEYEENKSERI